jgi:hypothetical protein
MTTIFQTLESQSFHQKKWRDSYFNACAKAGGCKTPHDISEFLPWSWKLTQMFRKKDQPLQKKSPSKDVKLLEKK